MKYSSKRNFKYNRAVDRRWLITTVLKKLKKTIHHAHVESVIQLLLQELKSELLKGNIINIPKFGNLFLTKTAVRKTFSYITNKVEEGGGNNQIKFVIRQRLRRFLIKRIDLDRTFGIRQDEG